MWSPAPLTSPKETLQPEKQPQPASTAAPAAATLRDRIRLSKRACSFLPFFCGFLEAPLPCCSLPGRPTPHCNQGSRRRLGKKRALAAIELLCDLGLVSFPL